MGSFIEHDKKGKHYKELLLMVLIIGLIVGLVLFTYGDQIARDKDEEKAIIDKYAHNGKLIYVADESTPPIRFLDEDGVFKGVVVDYMGQLSLEIGAEIKCMPYQWDKAQKLLKEDKANFADMFMSKERLKNFAFSDPIYYLRGAAAVRQDFKEGENKVNGLVIATAKGDFSNEYLKDNYKNSKLVYVENVKEGIKLLKQHKVDAVVGDEPIVYHYIQQLKLNGEIKILEKELYEEPVVIAVPKNQEELIPIVNRGIDKINKNKQLEQIQRKWFGISAPLKEVYDNDKLISYIIGIIAVGLIVIFTIILVNRKLKREVRIRTSEIEMANYELQKIIDDMPASIALINGDKGITKLNKGTVFDLSEDGMEIRECKDVFTNLCQDCSNCIIDECISKGGEIKREIENRGKIYLMTAHKINRDTNDTLMTVIDITDAAAQRNLLLQSGKMVAVGQLAAGMAHELRNPLGIIGTQSYLLKKHISDENALKSLKYITDNVARAGNIIDSVMNFWRVSDDIQVYYNLKKAVRNILEMQGDNLSKKNIEVVVNCNEELEIPCSIETIKHILVNLMSNAIDAIGSNGKITVNGISETEKVIIEFIDTGSGIKDSDLENIFNPFFTTKAPGKGTGLGLFIVYSEVQKLKGEVKVSSKVGGGTTFRITLPKKRGEINGKDVKDINS